MIVSFGSDETEELYVRGRHPRWHPDLCRAAVRKLVMMDEALGLADLRAIPGNRLEKLSGRREGFHSIRVNDQWRIRFVWGPLGPEEVELCDYHWLECESV